MRHCKIDGPQLQKNNFSSNTIAASVVQYSQRTFRDEWTSTLTNIVSVVRTATQAYTHARTQN